MINKNDVVAVIMGGPSSEAEISRVTGGAIAEALLEKGYNVKSLELNPVTVVEDLKACNVKVVFNAVHGMYGEDGRLQSILEAVNIPYTGSRVMPSAIAMDKAATKRFLLTEKISTPDCLIFNKKINADFGEIKKVILEKFTLPVVIKAASQGSSIGVEIVKEQERIEAALEEVSAYSENILVEEYIQGKELTVAVMEADNEIKPLPVIMIAPHSGAYDFHSKYTKGATDYLVPAPLDEETTEKVQALAVATYKVLGLSGVARIDIMLGSDNQGYVLEANTVPGMTATSLVPKAAKAVGISFADLCEMILLSAR